MKFNKMSMATGAVLLCVIATAGCSRALSDGVSIGVTDGLSDGISSFVANLIESASGGAG